MTARRVAVIGAGWAGLAAAVRATEQGAQVTLFDMAQQPGGRARALASDSGPVLDNGQHILIGAYQETLCLMRRVGVNPDSVLHRLPLILAYPDGSGLKLPTGPAVPAFVRGVLGWRDQPMTQRLRLLAMAARWRWQGFRCDPGTTVAQLCVGGPPGIYRDLIEPLCVAALNTPADSASAAVLLTVLRDALFGAPGAADLLLPRVPLSSVLPDPAHRWLTGRGARVLLSHRVQHLERKEACWQVDGANFDHVVVATTAGEAARLTSVVAPDWAAMARAFSYQPIITVWLRAAGVTWPHPMMALRATPHHPAQFGFDLGALQGLPGTFALVISGAGSWVDRGLADCVLAVRNQLAQAFAGTRHWIADDQVEVVAVRAEKRATFACVPGLTRPPPRIQAGLIAAGDYVSGPYPATLEGAVRSGLQAVADR